MGLAVLGFVGLMAWGVLNQQSATGHSGVTRVGKLAPEFILPLFDGGVFTLSEYRGQPVLINFWASWCVPCRIEAPVLEEAWRAYRDRGVVFVGVDIQDTAAGARSYIQGFHITYPNGPDPTGEITIDYGVVGIPVTFFVDREGIVVRRYVGALTERQLVAWTEELIEGRTPSGDVEEGNLEDYFELGPGGGQR